MEIKFKGLPFEPVEGQVIYYESKRDSMVSKFIRNNYDWVVALFRQHGMDFCYIPQRVQETLHYYAPYASAQSIKEVPNLSDYAVDSPVTGPSLLFALDIPVKDDEGNTVLQCVPIVTNWFKSTSNVFRNLVLEIERDAADRSRYYHNLDDEKLAREDNVRFSLFEDSEEPVGRRGIKFAAGIEKIDKKTLATSKADEDFDEEVMEVVDEIKERLKMLQMRGINMMFLHEILNKESKLSRLRITADKRLFLVDYNNREIQMTPLVKAVFLLFLKHPEGIRFKELSDYYDELLGIYKSLKPNGSPEKHKHSISDIVNPFSNSINEKCARIREAFIGSFEERLANNYFVTGTRGEPKCITIDRNLVIWD